MGAGAEYVGGGGLTRVACGPHSARSLSSAPDVTSLARTPAPSHTHHHPPPTICHYALFTLLQGFARNKRSVFMQAPERPRTMRLTPASWHKYLSAEGNLIISIQTGTRASDVASHISIRAYQRRFDQLRHQRIPTNIFVIVS